MRLCEFNVENLFVSMEYHAGEPLAALDENAWRQLALAQLRRQQKPLAKLFGLARAIGEIDPDLLLLVEIGGRDSLENFNRHFLGDRYAPFFVEGNSKRSIDLGFLVRRELAPRVTVRSHRDRPIEVNSLSGRYAARFSRDVAELRVHDEAGAPRLITLLTHLKSKLSTREDFQGKDVRTAEAMALAELYRARREEHPEAPIVVGGDFNAELGSLELELLRRTDLADFQDVLGTPPEDRATLVHFATATRPVPLVLDYLLISPQLRDRVVRGQSGVHRYRGFYGIPDELPRTLRERGRMPSDHYPLVLTLDI
jgi:endonuclease/exonuclease/phosphatase family metal-dependent hydrolase